MAQAKKKRKYTAAKTVRGPRFSAHGTGMLIAGVVIGSLGTILWQGLQSDDSDVGSGIRDMLEQSRQRAEAEEAVKPKAEVTVAPQSTNYDFFTVLPEIEVVVPDDAPPEKVAKNTSKPEDELASTNGGEGDVKPEVVQTGSAYMLQAGSYQRQSDADRQKAKLAFLGLGSTIQKITIQGRGDFYRVRLGPYINHHKMVEVDERLRQEGIKALRLKISRAG